MAKPSTVSRFTDDEYRRVIELMPIPCVDVVIFNDGGEFLLGRRRNRPAQGQWWIPGGRIKKNEGLGERAVIDRVRDETGLIVKRPRFLTIYDLRFPDSAFGPPAQCISLLFTARVDGPTTPRVDSQHSEFRWVSRDQLSRISPAIDRQLRLQLQQACELQSSQK